MNSQQTAKDLSHSTWERIKRAHDLVDELKNTLDRAEIEIETVLYLQDKPDTKRVKRRRR